eukprot:2047316-Pyramimonas_sp.AAC.1
MRRYTSHGRNRCRHIMLRTTSHITHHTSHTGGGHRHSVPLSSLVVTRWVYSHSMESHSPRRNTLHVVKAHLLAVQIVLPTPSAGSQWLQERIYGLKLARPTSLATDCHQVSLCTKRTRSSTTKGAVRGSEPHMGQ